jgi:hypothetical protein
MLVAHVRELSETGILGAYAGQMKMDLARAENESAYFAARGPKKSPWQEAILGSPVELHAYAFRAAYPVLVDKLTSRPYPDEPDTVPSERYRLVKINPNWGESVWSSEVDLAGNYDGRGTSDLPGIPSDVAYDIAVRHYEDQVRHGIVLYESDSENF